MKSTVLKRVGTAFVALTIALGGSQSVHAASVTISTNQYTEASRPTVIGTATGYPQAENTYFHNLSVNTDGNLVTWTSGRNLYLYNKAAHSTKILQTSTVNLYDAVISLDGSYIVYQENLSSTFFNLVGYSVASKAKKVLATSTQKFFGVPSLSQDGSKVFSISFGAAILLNNKKDADYYLKKLESTEKELMKELPIYTLYERL